MVPYQPAELILQFTEPIARQQSLPLSCTGIADEMGNQEDTLRALVDHRTTQLVAASFYTDSVLELRWSAPLAEAGRWSSDEHEPRVIYAQLLADSTVLRLGLSNRWVEQDLHLRGEVVIDVQGEILPAQASTFRYQSVLDTMVLESSQLIAMYFSRPPAADYWSIPDAVQLSELKIGAVLPDVEMAGLVRLVLESHIRPNRFYKLQWAPGYYADGHRLPGGSQLLYWDQEAPRLQYVQFNTNQMLALTYTEPMKPSSLAAYNHYQLAGHEVEQIEIFGPDSLVQIEIFGPDSLVLHFSPALADGERLQLGLSGQQDLWSNQMADTSIALSYEARYLAQPGELLINEFLAAPQEEGGAWPTEYVELYNRSEKPLELSNYRLADARSAVPLPDYQLPAGEYLVLYPKQTNTVPNDAVQSLPLTTWPTLNNSRDALTLKSPAGVLLDSIS